jgi:hypothetical protein
MSGWLRYLTLKAQVSTGLNSQIVIWAVIAVIAAVVTFVFLLVAAFLWLSDLYDGVIAGLVLGAVFAVVAAIAAVACVMIRRHNMEEPVSSSRPAAAPRPCSIRSFWGWVTRSARRSAGASSFRLPRSGCLRPAWRGSGSDASVRRPTTTPIPTARPTLSKPRKRAGRSRQHGARAP